MNAATALAANPSRKMSRISRDFNAHPRNYALKLKYAFKNNVFSRATRKKSSSKRERSLQRLHGLSGDIDGTGNDDNRLGAELKGAGRGQFHTLAYSCRNRVLHAERLGQRG